MSWSVLQSAHAAAGNSGPSVTATFASGVTSGSKIIVATSLTGALNISSVQDAALNNWTLIGTASGTSVDLWLYALDTPPGDVGVSVAIKVTFESNAHDKAVAIAEVSGLLAGNTSAMVDGTPATLTGSTGTTGSPVYSSAAAGEFLVSAYGDFGDGNAVAPAGGWTLIGHNSSGQSNCLIEYVSSTGGSETNGFTNADLSSWAIIEAAFKVPAAAGGLLKASFP